VCDLRVRQWFEVLPRASTEKRRRGFTQTHAHLEKEIERDGEKKGERTYQADGAVLDSVAGFAVDHLDAVCRHHQAHFNGLVVLLAHTGDVLASHLLVPFVVHQRGAVVLRESQRIERPFADVVKISSFLGPSVASKQQASRQGKKRHLVNVESAGGKEHAFEKQERARDEGCVRMNDELLCTQIQSSNATVASPIRLASIAPETTEHVISRESEGSPQRETRAYRIGDLGRTGLKDVR
jgi:hypothetical protein